ncbi:hypothetical protein RA180_22140 [Aeromonas salmonicida]|uniref:hypothetical protein n=1 Tax=Aeromonas salmonicida TaxID=645 RepID=UPI002796B9CA|nr:hypothetical protein [Aeromonas salmonicida]MDQ1886689.1 hypothetical protein [Aeromonas salmonicida]
MNMNSKQTVNREEYRSLDNRVTCILQQRWPAKDISQWVGMLKGKQPSVACAIFAQLRWPCRTPLPTYRTCFKPRQVAPPCQCTPRYGSPVGRCHIADGLTPVAIDQSGTLWVARPIALTRAQSRPSMPPIGPR